MIATEDVGRFGARAFTDAERLNRREVDIAGDELTIPAACQALSKGIGRKIKLVQIPMNEIRKNSEEFALMLEWFERVGYEADIRGLEREFGIRPLTVEEWAAKQPVVIPEAT